MIWTKNDIVDYYKNTELMYKLWGRDMHYGYWEKGIWTQRAASLRFNQVMAEKARIGSDAQVLDAGCGVGGASIYLAKTYGCRVTGITICPRQVERARKNAQKEGVAHLTEFHEMDYLKTTFKDGTFDVVWGLESICYAASKEKFINEAFRVLNACGRLIVADGFASRKEYTGADKWQMQRWLDGWVVNSLDTPADFTAFADQAGFRTINYNNVTKKVMPTALLMFLASMPLLPLHILDRIVRLKPYPADALFNQYLAMRRMLWEYGIFFAEK